MADALDRSISIDFDRASRDLGSTPDPCIRNGSVERVDDYSRSEVHLNLGFIKIKRVHEKTTLSSHRKTRRPHRYRWVSRLLRTLRSFTASAVAHLSKLLFTYI